MGTQAHEIVKAAHIIERSLAGTVVAEFSRIREKQLVENRGSLHGSDLQMLVGASENIRDSLRAARQGDLQGACAFAGAAAGAFSLVDREDFAFKRGAVALDSMHNVIGNLVCRNWDRAEVHLEELAREVSQLNGLDHMLESTWNERKSA